MQILASVVIILLILFLPRLMVLLSHRFSFFSTLGPVFLCYAGGFLLSFCFEDRSLAATLSEVCVPVAIPLILFGANLSTLKRLAKPALTSFILMCVSVAAVSLAAFFIFRGSIHDARKICGMLIGLYTGGTPNLMAIGMALGLDQSRILLANAADLIVGGVYFFLLISAMPRLFRRVLPAYKSAENGGTDALREQLEREFIPEKQRFGLRELCSRLPAVGLAVLCVGLSLAVAFIITGNATNILVVMLGVTTFGVALSFVPRVHRLPGSYSTGQYFIYMFSVAMGLSFDLSAISASALMLIVMLLFVQFASVLLHMLLSRIAGLDADTALITSTAGIYGPAFIPSVANALGNRECILAGLICGILGYAVGNYLGIGVAWLLSVF